MTLSLYDYFCKVEDTRNKSGLRHPLPSFLSMATLSIMSGYSAFQEMKKFFKANEEAFTELFDLPHGVPGYTQIRTIFMTLDFNSLNAVFEEWSLATTDLLPSDWLSADGKVLGSTVTNPNDSKQNYVAMVSLFCNRLGVVLGTERYESKEASELHVAQDLLTNLLNELKGKGLIITLDALHCQKKQLS